MLLLETVFKAFDENQDGVVDLRELLIGLSVLCRAGNTIEQLATVFSLYDSNSDGYISPEEMEQYLYHVFKIVLALDVQQALQAEHTDAAAIAKSTTATCFQEADADGDGRLSFDEFIRWYLEEPSSPSRTRVVDQQVDAPFTVSLEALNALTTLEEVNAVLRSHADEHGMLNSYGFHKAMETFIKPNLTDGQHARATALLNHLFFAFGGADDGFVDYQ
ncbi:HPCA, partial [Symbiodinium sp. KB8]